VKSRLDDLLVSKGLFGSKTKAQASVMAGLVLVNNEKIEKPGTKVEETSQIRILGNAIPYVSRGGIKLEKALDHFNVEIKGLTIADIGAGTGGFTDCLLKKGAKKIYAIDVGYGQFDWKLRNDPRIVLIERKNARELKISDIGEQVDMVVMDVSFISILKILPAISNIINENGFVLTLIKPQFEAGRDDIPRGGVIKNKKVRDKVIENIKNGVEKLGFNVIGQVQSPITGREGNIEYFMYLRRS